MKYFWFSSSLKFTEMPEDKFILLFLGLVYLALLLFLLVPVGDDPGNKKFYIACCMAAVGLGYFLLVEILTDPGSITLELKSFWGFHLPAIFASLFSMLIMVWIKNSEPQRHR